MEKNFLPTDSYLYEQLYLKVAIRFLWKLFGWSRTNFIKEVSEQNGLWWNLKK